MNEFTITTQLINQVLEYLGTRPYKESAGLIQAINGEYEEAVKKQQLQQDIVNLEANHKYGKVQSNMYAKLDDGPKELDSDEVAIERAMEFSKKMDEKMKKSKKVKNIE